MLFFCAEIYNIITDVKRLGYTPTGIPLPFMSAGGTSLMVFMAVIGVLCNVASNNLISANFKKNIFKIVNKKVN